jgi:hypothetical protein
MSEAAFLRWTTSEFLSDPSFSEVVHLGIRRPLSFSEVIHLEMYGRLMLSEVEDLDFTARLMLSEVEDLEIPRAGELF